MKQNFTLRVRQNPISWWYSTFNIHGILTKLRAKKILVKNYISFVNVRVRYCYQQPCLEPYIMLLDYSKRYVIRCSKHTFFKFGVINFSTFHFRSGSVKNGCVLSIFRRHRRKSVSEEKHYGTTAWYTLWNFQNPLKIQCKVPYIITPLQKINFLFLNIGFESSQMFDLI